ncbi:hypothetical protein HaLaN_26927 [Haematococcus lacustris]|uniref:Uncharacterized protein n=1 Tax=Haematococcus lacustris TaxID=44745 RepID=A0A6A0A7D7_HAELA|nr:hypothetical protein HaLaN_26927 [Haematococcus lacustris]
MHPIVLHCTTPSGTTHHLSDNSPTMHIYEFSFKPQSYNHVIWLCAKSQAAVQKNAVTNLPECAAPSLMPLHTTRTTDSEQLRVRGNQGQGAYLSERPGRLPFYGAVYHFATCRGDLSIDLSGVVSGDSLQCGVAERQMAFSGALHAQPLSAVCSRSTGSCQGPRRWLQTRNRLQRLTGREEAQREDPGPLPGSPLADPGAGDSKSSAGAGAGAGAAGAGPAAGGAAALPSGDSPADLASVTAQMQSAAVG